MVRAPRAETRGGRRAAADSWLPGIHASIPAQCNRSISKTLPRWAFPKPAGVGSAFDGNDGFGGTFAMATADDAISFARDIRPLFRRIDLDHMGPMGVLLDDYEYMSDRTNAQAVFDFLVGTRKPRMPI